MSKMKNLMLDLHDKADSCHLWAYTLSTSLMQLSSFCWRQGPDVPLCAPDAETLRSIQSELDAATAALEEVRAAYSCLDALAERIPSATIGPASKEPVLPEIYA